MIEIEHRIGIECPAEDVWQVLADIPAWPTWTPTVKSARRISGEGQGARFALKQPLQSEATWIVTEWETGRVFTWEAAGTGRHYVGRHQLVDNGAHTESVACLRVEGLGKVISTLMRPILAAAIATENRALKARCEALRRGERSHSS